jgi:hypothetical protein
MELWAGRLGNRNPSTTQNQMRVSEGCGPREGRGGGFLGREPAFCLDSPGGIWEEVKGEFPCTGCGVQGLAPIPLSHCPSLDDVPALSPAMVPACRAHPFLGKHGNPCAHHEVGLGEAYASSRFFPSSHVLARVCVCVCPLLCRETVTVTQSKQVNGYQGHSYATFSVCRDSVTAL